MKRRRLDDDHRRNNNDEKEIINDSQISRSNNPYIPIELTAEILSRLPIKSIGRFISVSKSWRDVITGRRFSSLHAKNKPFSTFYKIGRRSDANSEFKHYVLEVGENGNSATTTIRPRINGWPGNIEIVGSCNGLLCLLEKGPGWFVDEVTVLNPITNERTVSTVPNREYWIRGLSKREFGYSPSTDEYKVFKYVEFGSCSEYAIFTIGVDRSWRELSPNLFPDMWMHRQAAVFCNGALHWLIDNSDPSSNHILAFDIAREETRRMPIRQGIERFDTRLSVFENRISLYTNWFERSQDRGNIVWNMEGSWSEVVVPTHFSIRARDNEYMHEFFEPLHCATKYGDVLLVGFNYRHTWLYCPKRKTHVNIEVVPFRAGRLFEFNPTFSSMEEILHGESSKL